MQKQRAWAEQKLKAGEKFGLAVEYPTFELLWYDIEWRTRQIMEDLVDPMQNQLLDNKDNINQLHQENKKQNDRFDELKETIFNHKGKLDVFEQINLKIADGVAKTKTLADEIGFVKKQVNTKMD